MYSGQYVIVIYKYLGRIKREETGLSARAKCIWRQEIREEREREWGLREFISICDRMPVQIRFWGKRRRTRAEWRYFTFNNSIPKAESFHELSIWSWFSIYYWKITQLEVVCGVQFMPGWRGGLLTVQYRFTSSTRTIVTCNWHSVLYSFPRNTRHLILEL